VVLAGDHQRIEHAIGELAETLAADRGGNAGPAARTGHAVLCGLSALPDISTAWFVVTSGDIRCSTPTPSPTGASLNSRGARHRANRR